MPDHTQMTARAVAGHEAYRVVATHGADVGTEILHGYAAAFILALAAVTSAESARNYLNEILPRSKMTALLKYDAPCTGVRLNQVEVKVLAALASAGSEFNVLAFRNIARRVRLNRSQIRLACRSLTRKGLAKFHRGCWTEDGEPAGSGYSATEVGHRAADEKLVDKIVLRVWD